MPDVTARYKAVDKYLRRCRSVEFLSAIPTGVDNVAVDLSSLRASSKITPFDTPSVCEWKRKFRRSVSQPADDNVSVVLGHVPIWRCNAHEAECPKIIGSGVDSLCPVIGYKSAPGMLLLPGYFGYEDQLALANECFREYTLPPNQSNITRLTAKLTRLETTTKENELDHVRHVDNNKTQVWPDVSFNAVRWVSLGHQYNWTERSYDAYVPLPTPLQIIASDAMASVAALKNSCQVSSDKSSSGFLSSSSEELWRTKLLTAVDIPVQLRCDTAIMNFYRNRDRLGGHQDNVEQNNVALVSISLGRACIFLVSSSEGIFSIILQSGDTLILTGLARFVLHGVPRLLGSNSTALNFKTGKQQHRRKCVNVPKEVDKNDETCMIKTDIFIPNIIGDDEAAANTCSMDLLMADVRSCERLQERTTSFQRSLLIETLANCRINLSIRRVEPT